MRQTVYADVLLAVNFFINYFLMLSVGKIMKSAVSRTRICLAAVFGAACSLSVFLPEMPTLLSMMYKLAVSAGMVAIAYRQRSLRSFGKYLLITCAVTFGFGGTMFALWLTVAPSGMVYRNGVAYFNISPEFIIGVTVLCYTVITLAGRFCESLEHRAGYLNATVYNEGSAAALRLMCDTGNLLTEPFSGYPVIVVRRSAAAGILPRHFEQIDATAGIASGGGMPTNFRVIPYSSVGGGGMLMAFAPEKIVITASGDMKHRNVDDDGTGKDEHRFVTRPKKARRELEHCYIAVTDSLADDEYDGVINPRILTR